jgi:signal transduction histidine kinase
VGSAQERCEAEALAGPLPFFSSIDAAELPELAQHRCRAVRVWTSVMLAMLPVLWAVDVYYGRSMLGRGAVYLALQCSAHLACHLATRSERGRRHSEGVLMLVALNVIAACCFAGWHATDGSNPFSSFAFLVPITTPAFTPVRPQTSFGLGLALGGLYSLASVLLPASGLLHWSSALPIALATGVIAALATQTQRRVLAELHRASTLAEQRARDLDDARNRALEAARHKSQFLANMSHEIRTPMTSILGFSEIALEELRSDVDLEEARRALSTVQRNGEHLLRILNDVLDLSRIESGQMSIERGACYPGELLRDLHEWALPRARAKGLDLVLSTPARLPFLNSDATRLRQILFNLTDNAL